MSQQLLLAIDQGTTSSRAIAFSADGEIVQLAQRELALVYPQDGWVEQNAEQIWQDTLQVCQQVVTQLGSATGIAAIGITNQRETTIVWNRHSGEPVYNAIVWQDRRTADDCEQLKTRTDEQQIARKTGLRLDPYFCASKIRWILDNVTGALQAALAGDLLFGTVDCYLLWKLTGGKQHLTDATNASRTLLYNIVDQQWDDELLGLFDIPRSMLPSVCDNTGDFGQTDKALFGSALPVAAMIGDQQSALIGQGCFAEGSFKATYGTGCFMLMNTGDKPVVSRHRLLATTAYRIAGSCRFAMEGSIFVAGAAIQWLRDGLQLIQQASDSEAMARSVENNGGVYFVPALTGLGAPHWRADARGVIVGLTRDSSSAHIVRAALEAQAYQTRDMVEAFLQDSQVYLSDGGEAAALSVLRVDGGLVANTFVCQKLADVLQTTVEVPEITEATAWGAASLAGLQAGLFKSLEDIADRWRLSRQYQPCTADLETEKDYANWRQWVKRMLM